MMTNKELLKVIKESFKTYLNIGTSRSNAKLKTLHGHIAKDLEEKLGNDFSVLSQGIGKDKEGSINGRYYKKKVDISICYKDEPVAGFAIKYVMRNYSQNSNYYFENMLGETANLRANDIPYFQIFIIFDQVPYYKKDGEFSRYDVITEHNLDKYLKLSNDDPSVYFHAPDKTLILLLKLKEKSPGSGFIDAQDYANYYQSIINDEDLIEYSAKIDDVFGKTVLLNDYENFINRTTSLINGKLK